MPLKVKHPCNHRGCKQLTNGRFCPEHTALQRREDDAHRGTTAERGYGARWQKASKLFLRQHPMCAACASVGLLNQASEVDHVTPHRGDYGLMWDEDNWQSLCSVCHKRKTAKEKIK